MSWPCNICGNEWDAPTLKSNRGICPDCVISTKDPYANVLLVKALRLLDNPKTSEEMNVKNLIINYIYHNKEDWNKATHYKNIYDEE